MRGGRGDRERSTPEGEGSDGCGEVWRGCGGPSVPGRDDDDRVAGVCGGAEDAEDDGRHGSGVCG